MKPPIYLLMPLLIFSCNSNKEDCFVMSTRVTMSVKSHDGKDLLDPKNPNAFHENDIRLFYLKKGKKTRSDDPYVLSVDFFDQRHEYVVGIHPNTKFPITLIQWAESDTDTIKCKIERSDCSEICTQVWFNGKEKWKITDGTPRFFEIVK